MRQLVGRGGLLIALGLGCTAFWTPPGAAAEVRYFRLQARQDFLAGTLQGLGLDSLGTLQLSDRADRLATVGTPFLFSVARHPDGWVVGTGNDGRVLLVEESGRSRLLFDAEEPEVFAVLVDEDGTVYAGTSPNGRVYRIRDGEAEVVFDPGEIYIWSLARAADGSLLVATGIEGRLYRVAKAESEILFDADDPHLRSLSVLEDGRILVGTAGSGQIVELRDGQVRTLFDADQPEIVALSGDGAGGFYAAAVTSPASFVEAVRTGRQRGERGTDEEGEGSPEEEGRVTVLVGSDAEPSSTGPSGGAAERAGPRSVLLHGSRLGAVQAVERLDGETVYGLLWHRDRLWIGTGQEGKLYSRQSDGDLVLAKDVDERQVIALAPDTPGPVFATTNAAALYRISARSERRGEFTSAALDAEQVSRFGSFHWEGELRGGRLAFSFRSGMSGFPDRTWSEWTPAAIGNDLSLESVPPGRYVQVRAEFQASDGHSPTLRRATLSYRQQNLPPRVRSFRALAPGEIRVPPSFRSDDEVLAPARPDRSGLFTPLEALEEENDGRTKTLWKLGYRTLVWEAEDPNRDELVFDLEFRPEGAEGWLPMAQEVKRNFYPFDSTTLPDGIYRFRLVAKDRPAADEEPAASEERVSEPITVDNSPPRLEAAERRSARLTIRVEDDWSPLRRIAVSVDGSEWREQRTADGLIDGLSERLDVELPAGTRLLLLRLEDASHNAVTVDLSRWLRSADD